MRAIRCCCHAARPRATVNNWFLMNGFSIGIGDGIANEATMSQVEQIIKRSKGTRGPPRRGSARPKSNALPRRRPPRPWGHSRCPPETVKGIIEKARKGQLDPEPGMTLRETFEAMINKALNETRNESGKKAMESLKVGERGPPSEAPA